MSTGSALERRRERNAALVASHPHWHGIRHPELIEPPSRRFSQLDMLPAIEHEHAWPRNRRIEETRDIIAAHPRWRGIRHPERIFFSTRLSERQALLDYRAAVLRALEHVHESEELCRQISAVADSIGRHSWPWAAAPIELRTGSRSRWRRPRLPALRGRPGRARPRAIRPTGRLLAH